MKIKKGYIRLVLALLLAGVLLSFCAMCVWAFESPYLPPQRGKVKVIDTGKYLLYDNYAKFNGAIYEYNLDDFFEDSSVNFYDYSFNPELTGDDYVKIDNSVLRIVPPSPVNERKIFVTATETTSGDVFTAEFCLKYINAIDHMSSGVLEWIIWTVLILIILIALNYCIPIKGYISYTVIRDGRPLTSADVKKVRGCKYKIPEDGIYKIKGRFYGSFGKAIRFVPDNREVYAFVENKKHIQPIRAMRIKVDKPVRVYYDASCAECLEIVFLKEM